MSLKPEKIRPIVFNDIATYSKSFKEQRANIAAAHAVAAAGISKATRDLSCTARAPHSYSIRLKPSKEVTNQKQSGRCWMFAALNTMRGSVIERFKLESFELSQTYAMFFDKFEKANWFYESILDTLDEPLDGRLVNYLLTDPVQDGGQWDMFASLIRKYGVVPKYAMPETACSENSREMNALLTHRLREDACELRSAHEKGVSIDDLKDAKVDMLETIHRMLVICLGEPPVSFDLSLQDKDQKIISEASITPLDFFNRYVDFDLDAMISLINAPTAQKPFDRTYTVEYLGNVVEAGGVKYLNLEISQLKDAAIAQLKDGRPVWFGCDVGREFNRQDGLLDIGALDTTSTFDTSFIMDKGQRLNYADSCMSHAMVIQGVDLDTEGNPTRWCIENSWGKDAGRAGYLTMTDEWFTQYVFQIVVDKRYLPLGKVKLWEEEPIVLVPWDPMGALA